MVYANFTLKIECFFNFLALLLRLEQKGCFYSILRARFSQERAIACISGKSGSFNLVIKNFLKNPRWRPK